jgi:glycosyltransferase involved in cell wall biosynthesis
MKVILTVPSLGDPGGVAGLYRGVLPYLADDDVTVSPMEMGGTHRSLGPFHPISDQLKLAVRLSREPADLLAVNPSLDPKSFLRDGLFIRQALRRKLAVVVFFHGWWAPFERTVEAHLMRFFRSTFGRADAILVLASAFAEKLRQWGVKAPIRLARTAVSDEMFDGFSIEGKVRRILESPPLPILFLSRLEEGKGIFETLDAMSILVKRGFDARLDIAGDGSAAEAVRQRIASRGELSGRVRMLGYVRGERKREVLESHAIYCFPSVSEGMPLSLLEAMGFGHAVVTRPVGGIKDFFADATMGYAADGGSPEELADLLESLLSDNARTAEMARFNHEWVQGHCRASQAAEDLMETYRQALAASRARLGSAGGDRRKAVQAAV